MSNLPLKVLPWNAMHTEDKRIFVEHAQGAGVFYTVYGAVDSDFGTRWHDQMEGSHGKKEGFESIEEVKLWIETDHYPSKMQPYVKPSPTWISVDDRLPEKHTNVLVMYHAHFDDEPITEFDFCTAFFDGETFDPKDQLFYTKRNTTVVHWMPIPEFSTMQNLHNASEVMK